MTKDVKIVLAYVAEGASGETRWEEGLRHLTTALLSQVIGSPVVVRPLVLKEGESIAEEALDADLFLAVISRAAATNSQMVEACDRFLRKHRDQETLSLDGRYRFLPVYKTFLSLPEALEYARFVPQYDFCDIDVLTGNPRTYDYRMNSVTQRAYWLKLSDMCYDMAYVIRRGKQGSAPTQQLGQTRTVYLAAVGADMSSTRDLIKRELIQRNFRVLPDHALANASDELEADTYRDLHDAVLSIHLIGEDHGRMLSDTEQSVVSLQNTIAHAHALSVLEQRKRSKEVHPFHRLIWLNPDVHNLSDVQRIFIENLKSEAATIEEAEVMEIPLEEFKFIIRMHMAEFEAEANLEEADDDGRRRVYLIYNQEDAAQASSIASVLVDEGIEVLSLSGEGTPSVLRKEHQEHLRRCHGSIIYVREANDQWFGSRLQDVFKAPAFGRTYPMLARAVVFDRDRDFEMGDLQKYITVLSNGAAQDPSKLRPFIRDVKRTEI